MSLLPHACRVLLYSHLHAPAPSVEMRTKGNSDFITEVHISNKCPQKPPYPPPDIDPSDHRPPVSVEVWRQYSSVFEHPGIQVRLITQTLSAFNHQDAHQDYSTRHDASRCWQRSDSHRRTPHAEHRAAHVPHARRTPARRIFHTHTNAPAVCIPCSTFFSDSFSGYRTGSTPN